MRFIWRLYRSSFLAVTAGLVGVWVLSRLLLAQPQPQKAAAAALPYLVSLTPQYEIQPVLTVGDEVPRLEGAYGSFSPSPTQTFALTGLPDGLGVFAAGDTYYVIVNHELPTGQYTPLSLSGPEIIFGARVSLFQFTKDWQPIGGRNLIERVLDRSILYELDTTSGSYLRWDGLPLNADQSVGPNFSRFCSGSLVESGFFTPAGSPSPIWFAPEEHSTGRGWAVTLDGMAVALTGLGRFSKEQIYAPAQYRPALADSPTVLLATEDSSDGEIYMYLGVPSPLDPNGFNDGQLYVLRVVDPSAVVYDYEQIPAEQTLTGQWVPIPNTIVSQDSAAALSEWVNTSGNSTNFRRPEDLHEDPTSPGTFYFASTGTLNTVPGTSISDNPNGKLYRFRLNPDDPTGDMPFEYLLSGGPDTGVSYDNLTVDHNRQVLIQEDSTAGGSTIIKAQKRYARILAYDPASGKVRFLFEANQPGIDPGTATSYGAWETTGIIELPKDARTTWGTYLVSVQAHTLRDLDHLQGGQLVRAIPISFRIYLPLTQQ